MSGTGFFVQRGWFPVWPFRGRGAGRPIDGCLLLWKQNPPPAPPVTPPCWGLISIPPSVHQIIQFRVVYAPLLPLAESHGVSGTKLDPGAPPTSASMPTICGFPSPGLTRRCQINRPTSLEAAPAEQCGDAPCTNAAPKTAWPMVSATRSWYWPVRKIQVPYRHGAWIRVAEIHLIYTNGLRIYSSTACSSCVCLARGTNGLL